MGEKVQKFWRLADTVCGSKRHRFRQKFASILCVHSENQSHIFQQ